MSELSAADYRNKTRAIIDNGIYDPDQIFQELVCYYLMNDPKTDWFYDTQDDMEELFVGMSAILGTNFRGQPHSSKHETEDAKRFRKVRNWVENVHYDQEGLLARNSPAQQTNPGRKFDEQMDKVMHMIRAAAISAYAGETVADVGSWGNEVFDGMVKRPGQLIGRRLGLYSGVIGSGYDQRDLQWGLYGSELQNHFDLFSDEKARRLAKKFANGTFVLSRWQDWYNASSRTLYD